MLFSCRRRALELMIVLRFDFLVTPLAWCAARTAGRRSTDSWGGRTIFRDLSVSMPGDVSLRAARECLDDPERRTDNQLIFTRLHRNTVVYRPFLGFDIPPFAIVPVLALAPDVFSLSNCPFRIASCRGAFVLCLLK